MPRDAANLIDEPVPAPSEELAPVTAYRMRNWRRFQHYKRGQPPWIKLHRDLVDNRDWSALSDAAARLLVELWLIASEGDRNGDIPSDTEWLAWRLRRASSLLAACLQELLKAGFLMELRGILASGYSSASTRLDRAEAEQRQSRAEGTCDDCGRPLTKTKTGRVNLCQCRTQKRA
jgi:hypothetical protein